MMTLPAGAFSWVIVKARSPAVIGSSSGNFLEAGNWPVALSAPILVPNVEADQAQPSGKRTSKRGATATFHRPAAITRIIPVTRRLFFIRYDAFLRCVLQMKRRWI